MENKQQTFLPQGYKLPEPEKKDPNEWKYRYCDKIQDDEFTLGEQRGANITFK